MEVDILPNSPEDWCQEFRNALRAWSICQKTFTNMKVCTVGACARCTRKPPSDPIHMACNQSQGDRRKKTKYVPLGVVLDPVVTPILWWCHKLWNVYREFPRTTVHVRDATIAMGQPHTKQTETPNLVKSGVCICTQCIVDINNPCCLWDLAS